MKTADLLAAAILLPVEERVRVIDSLLKSLNPPEADIDEEWGLVARGTSRGQLYRETKYSEISRIDSPREILVAPGGRG